MAIKQFFEYNIKPRLYSVRSLFGFMWANKLWWMIPLVISLFLFGLVIILGQATPLGPFIYTIF